MRLLHATRSPRQLPHSANDRQNKPAPLPAFFIHFIDRPAGMSKKKQPFDFEQSLSALQTTVEQLESGDLSLDEALQAFEKGIGLSRDCQQALDQARQRITMLLEQNGQLQEVPLPDSTSASPAGSKSDDLPF